MTDTYLPRLFWRRLAAFIVDFLCIEVALVILVLLVQPLFTTHFSVPKPITTYTCDSIDSLGESAFVLPLLKIQRGDQVVVSLCAKSLAGLVPDRTLSFHILHQTGNKTFRRTLNVPVDDALKPVAQIDFGSLLALLAPLLFALCLTRFGTTPGKKLMRLKLRRDSGKKPGLVQLAKREYLRLSPGVVFGITSVVFGGVFFNPKNIEKMVSLINDASRMKTLLILMAVVSAGFSLIFLVSFARWRGRMIYDKLAGFEIVLDDPSQDGSADKK